MSEEEQRRKLERLKAVRRGNRGVITKLCREIDTLMAVESFNTDPSSLSRLNVIHEQLDGKMKQFSNLDGEMLRYALWTRLKWKLKIRKQSQ